MWRRLKSDVCSAYDYHRPTDVSAPNNTAGSSAQTEREGNKHQCVYYTLT